MILVRRLCGAMLILKPVYNLLIIEFRFTSAQSNQFVATGKGNVADAFSARLLCAYAAIVPFLCD